MSALFPDVVQCMSIQVLEIKKSTFYPGRRVRVVLIAALVVYLYLVSYGRGKPDQINYAVQNFLQVGVVISPAFSAQQANSSTGLCRP